MIRPVGNGVICGATLGPLSATIAPSRQPIIPYPTGRVSGGYVPGIPCLATIIWSLRDKHTCVLMLTRMRRRGVQFQIGALLHHSTLQHSNTPTLHHSAPTD